MAVWKPFDDGGAGQHFTFRFGQRLALLLRQQAGDGVGAFAQQHGGAQRVAAEDLRARVQEAEAAGEVGLKVDLEELLSDETRQMLLQLLSRRKTDTPEPPDAAPGTPPEKPL